MAFMLPLPCRSKPSEAICEWCSAHFRRKRSGGKDSLRFCSRHCAFASAAKRKSDRIATKQAKREARLAVLRSGREARQARRQEARLRRVVSPCQTCGVDVVSKRGKSKCEACHRRYWRRLRRAKSGSERHTARARRKGLPRDYSITPDKLFARDGWVCQICGGRTPRSLKGKQQPKSPTIDHIVPIASGGGHVWENVQTACHACNQTKGNKVMGQLRLVG